MHNPEIIEAYKISGDHLQYQTNSQGISSEWTGMTLDPNSGIAFVTTEADHNIYFLNAQSMIFESAQTLVNDTASLAGIVTRILTRMAWLPFRPFHGPVM